MGANSLLLDSISERFMCWKANRKSQKLYHRPYFLKWQKIYEVY